MPWQYLVPLCILGSLISGLFTVWIVGMLRK